MPRRGRKSAPGSMSGDGKRSVGHRPQATAPIGPSSTLYWEISLPYQLPEAHICAPHHEVRRTAIKIWLTLRSHSRTVLYRGAAMAQNPAPRRKAPWVGDIGISQGFWLVFRCPRTGLPLVSGVHTDRQTLSRVGHISVKVPCTHCKEVHLFAAGQGYLESEG